MTVQRTVVLVGCLLAVAVLGCGGGNSEEERKAQALDIARNWTERNTKPVVAEIVSLATAAIPGASLVSNLIADKITDFLTWEYSEPVKASENMYDVTATVSTQATLDIPLAGEKTYGASLPFNLRVDVDRSAVTEWSADLGGGSIGEIEATP